MTKAKPTIATLGSHSALDVCRGAKKLGFSTLVVAQQGREKTYNQYYRSRKEKIESEKSGQSADLGCVDDCIVLPKFKDILKPAVQQQLHDKNAIFIPNRSLEAYLNFDYDAIEQQFKVPLFGNKYLLRIEERSARPNQYDLLDQAGIKYPRHFSSPQDIDRLCLIKTSEVARSFERAFFLASNFEEYTEVSEQMIQEGKISREALASAVIEEFVLGAQVNFNFFYSPISERLELMGTDTRRQTNLDGLLRLPGLYQTAALEKVAVSYEEAGHVAVTVLESLLEPAFAAGEAFVAAAQKMSAPDSAAPGIIGPFALQSIITAGPPKKEIIVIDVSPRMPGSPGIAATPYSSYLYGQSMSAGERVAREIKMAIELNQLAKITT